MAQKCVKKNVYNGQTAKFGPWALLYMCSTHIFQSAIDCSHSKQLFQFWKTSSNHVKMIIHYWHHSLLIQRLLIGNNTDLDCLHIFLCNTQPAPVSWPKYELMKAELRSGRTLCPMPTELPPLTPSLYSSLDSHYHEHWVCHCHVWRVVVFTWWWHILVYKKAS